MPYQAPRGTHDVLPDEVHLWQFLELTFAQLVESFGYREIRTPAFEDTELFVRTSGDTSEVVTKQMYSFRDKGDRELTLKPEGTAPAMRSYLEHRLGQTGQTTRLWYTTPIFRYERPQKGRYRQAHQVGLELVGSPSPAADAEVIELTVRFYEELGLHGVTVLVNSIGRAAARESYCTALLAHAEPVLRDMETEARAQVERNPLRLLDSKVPEVIEVLRDAPSIVDYLEPDSRAHFGQVCQILDEQSINYTPAPHIVRGLDYYTDTVFEVQSDALGAQSSLCGGGRYDGLIQAIGGSATPAVGVAMGIERAILALQATENALDAPTPDYYGIALDEASARQLRQVATQLREGGARVVVDLDPRSLKSLLKAADRSGADQALIIGESEVSDGTVIVRDLRAGTQVTIPVTQLQHSATL